MLSEQFVYPNSPLLGIEIDATEQLNGGTPTVTAVNGQRPGMIWDGQSTSLPALRKAYTKNPAWLALGLILDRRVGLGQFYHSTSPILPSFLEWANYCDEITYDGTRRIQVDNAGAVGTHADLFYTAVQNDETGAVRGSIIFQVSALDEDTLPATWREGRFLRLTGWPTDATPGVNVDPNTVEGEGYEIFDVSLIQGDWRVSCYWDRLEEGDLHTTGSSLNGAIGDTTTIDGGIVAGASRRFEFNGVFDRRGRAWDSLLEVCAVGRATPIPTGSAIRMRFAAPRSPVGVITPGLIIEDTFRVDYASPRTRENALTLNILDAQQEYEPVPIAVRDPSLDTESNQSFIRQGNRQLFGVTDAGQAERHGNYILNVHRLQRRSGSFSANVATLPNEVGDVLRVTSDVLPRGKGGTVAANSASNNLGMTDDREAFGGAAWTASGVAITADTATDPYGDAVADTISGTGFVEQALAPNVPAEGWHTVSVFLKDSSGAAPALELETDRAASSVSFDLGAVTATASGSFDLPAKGGVQDVGGGWRFAWASFFVKAADSKRVSTLLDLRLYPVLGAGTADVIASKIAVTQEEFPATGPGIRSIVLDAEIEVAAVGDTKLHIQDARGDLATVTIDSTLTPPGTYPAGSVLFSSTVFPSPPTRGNPVIVSTIDDELLVEIKGVRRGPDLRADFEWVEYDEDVFDDDPVEDDDLRDGDTGGNPGGGVGTRISNTIRPATPIGMAASSFAVEDGSGSFTVTAAVSWTNDPGTASVVTANEVFFRQVDSTAAVSQVGGAPGGWTRAGRVAAQVLGIEFPIPGALTGRVVEVAVVPVSRAYPDAAPDRGARTSFVASALAWRPEAPTSLELASAGLAGVYSASYDDSIGDDGRRQSRRLVIRRGGWILGQSVASLPEGELQSDPLEDVYVPAGGASVGRLFARTASRADVYSSSVQVDATPELPFADELPELSYGPDEEWETSQGAAGWVVAVPAAEGPTLGSSLQQNAAGEIEFGASGLTGFYTTARDAAETVSVGQSREPRPLYVGAACEAVQVHPQTIGDWTWPCGSLEGQRWTLEGPAQPTAVDGPNCSLEIQFRLNVDGTADGWGAWRRFRCGVHTFVDIQFRLRIERPDTTYNVRVKRFHTTVRVPRRALTQQTTRDLAARSLIL